MPDYHRQRHTKMCISDINRAVHPNHRAIRFINKNLSLHSRSNKKLYILRRISLCGADEDVLNVLIHRLVILIDDNSLMVKRQVFVLLRKYCKLMMGRDVDGSNREGNNEIRTETAKRRKLKKEVSADDKYALQRLFKKNNNITDGVFIYGLEESDIHIRKNILRAIYYLSHIHRLSSLSFNCYLDTLFDPDPVLCMQTLRYMKRLTTMYDITVMRDNLQQILMLKECGGKICELVVRVVGNLFIDEDCFDVLIDFLCKLEDCHMVMCARKIARRNKELLLRKIGENEEQIEASCTAIGYVDRMLGRPCCVDRRGFVLLLFSHLVRKPNEYFQLFISLSIGNTKKIVGPERMYGCARLIEYLQDHQNEVFRKCFRRYYDKITFCADKDNNCYRNGKMFYNFVYDVYKARKHSKMVHLWLRYNLLALDIRDFSALSVFLADYKNLKKVRMITQHFSVPSRVYVGDVLLLSFDFEYDGQIADNLYLRIKYRSITYMKCRNRMLIRLRYEGASIINVRLVIKIENKYYKIDKNRQINVVMNKRMSN